MAALTGKSWSRQKSTTTWERTLHDYTPFVKSSKDTKNRLGIQYQLPMVGGV